MPLGKHAKIAIGWAITVTGGIYLFYLSKASVDRHRYENMKIRERMKQANIVILKLIEKVEEMAEGDAQKLMQEIEIEMMADIYNRLTTACHKKCIPPVYHESEIAKGEAVCIDRCVAKFLDIYERIGKKLGQLSMQDEQLLKK